MQVQHPHAHEPRHPFLPQVIQQGNIHRLKVLLLPRGSCSHDSKLEEAPSTARRVTSGSRCNIRHVRPGQPLVRPRDVRKRRFRGRHGQMARHRSGRRGGTQTWSNAWPVPGSRGSDSLDSAMSFCFLSNL